MHSFYIQVNAVYLERERERECVCVCVFFFNTAPVASITLTDIMSLCSFLSALLGWQD